MAIQPIYWEGQTYPHEVTDQRGVTDNLR
jgi:hypothetical protein